MTQQVCEMESINGMRAFFIQHRENETRQFSSGHHPSFAQISPVKWSNSYREFVDERKNAFTVRGAVGQYSSASIFSDWCLLWRFPLNWCLLFVRLSPELSQSDFNNILCTPLLLSAASRAIQHQCPTQVQNAQLHVANLLWSLWFSPLRPFAARSKMCRWEFN